MKVSAEAQSPEKIPQGVSVHSLAWRVPPHGICALFALAERWVIKTLNLGSGGLGKQVEKEAVAWG